MKHAKVSRAWRPVRARHGYRQQHGSLGVLSALAFNLCLLLLPLAGAAALIVIARDNLYAYEYSDNGAQMVRDRVSRLNGELIQIDFDRQRQWDDLVAMELRAGDTAAARGFLLSGPGMLPSRSANVLNQALNADASDAELEVAALQLLTPSTRQTYQEQVRLLSQRGAAAETAAPTLADPQDFELMARALISEPETDALQFILTGFSLGFAGDLSPRMQAGAVALLASSRRDDFPDELKVAVDTLLGQAAPIEPFRAAARESAGEGDIGAYTNIATAFRASIHEDAASDVRAMLDQIGAISQATNTNAAAAMLTHALAVADFERLALVARASGDRAAAAAKRLPRDGRLLNAARGELTFTRDLISALTVAAAAALGLIAVMAIALFKAAQRAWKRMRAEDDEDDYGAELIDISTNNWRPL